MKEVLEMCMMICFGSAWPMAIIKSYKAKTAKNKSLIFLCCIFLGISSGIISKIISGRMNYVIIFYVINMIMVSIDMGLYFRNKKLDSLADNENNSDNSGNNIDNKLDNTTQGA